MGDYVPRTVALAEFDALFTAGLASGSIFPMFLFNFLAFKAVVVVVVDLSISGWLLD